MNEEEKNKKTRPSMRWRGTLKDYFRWPLYLTLLLLFLTLITAWVNPKAVGLMLVYTFVIGAACALLFWIKKSDVLAALVKYATGYNQIQHVFLKELDIPYGILDVDGSLLWANNEMRDIIKYDRVAHQSIQEIFPNLKLDVLPTIEEDVEEHITVGRTNYRVRLRMINMNEVEEDALWEVQVGDQENAGMLIGMYLYDETEILALKKVNFDEKMIVGLLYIDNYEEAFDNSELDEGRRSVVSVWIERTITKYMRSIDAIIKKTEKDKYVFMFKQKYLSVLEANRFSLLEEIRNMNMYDVSVTISMGIGVGATTYSGSYDLARAAIDLALERGGDQAVIRNGDQPPVFYGGKSAQKEKTSRVKARVKALALKEYIEEKEKVIIMGHSRSDADALGSAIGIYRIAKSLDKRAYIVLNDVSNAIRPVWSLFQNNPDYEEDMFISGSKAQEIMNGSTLLVVVDVNDPDIMECPPLLTMTKSVVMIDHHRQKGKAIENAVLSYIDPSASSACEMVAEIAQYILGNGKIKQIEADAMYSGIMIDTDNFLTKTGVRCFEAAAYLKRCGADVTKIRKRFRTDFDEYKIKAQVMSTAQLFMQYYIFAELNEEASENPTVLAAKIANELLNVDSIKASFVFTRVHDRVFISARSIDELNVQVVMEGVGGGGHMSVAGAQIPDCSVEEAMEKVKAKLQEMKDKGDI